MNKTELIHNLVKVLEQLETDLDFTVFYTWKKIISSTSFCPAFDFEGYYYEIQYDYEDQLQVLRWLPIADDTEEGRLLTEKEIEELISELKEVEIKDLLEGEGWQHFLKGDIITSEFSEDVIYSIRTEKLTREEIQERYNIKS